MYTLEDVVLVCESPSGLASLYRMTYLTEAEIPDEFEDGVNQWWIPHSLIESTDMEDVGDQGYVEIPMWLARKEEMPGT